MFQEKSIPTTFGQCRLKNSFLAAQQSLDTEGIQVVEEIKLEFNNPTQLRYVAEYH